MNKSMFEIICMFQIRGNSFKMPENGKKRVTLQIMAHLKRNLQYQNLECSLEDKTIINKINKLIEAKIRKPLVLCLSVPTNDTFIS